jgi:putative ABC transport system permease protein
MALLCQEFVVLVGLSILIASPLAWIGMHRWLQDYAYKVSIGAWVFIVSGCGAIIIALATVSFQAFRAARANPVNSLKAE